MSGLKEKSLNRINITTMNESFKKSETSYKSQDTIAKLNSQDNKGKTYFLKFI